jgi:hypothetical protein
LLKKIQIRLSIENLKAKTEKSIEKLKIDLMVSENSKERSVSSSSLGKQEKTKNFIESCRKS